MLDNNLHRTLIPIALALAAVGWLGAKEFRELHARLAEFERTPRADPKAIDALERELADVRDELGATKSRVERDRAKLELARRLFRLEAKVSDADCTLAEQASRLSSWESSWSGFEPELDSRLEKLKVGLDERCTSLYRIANDTAKVADEDRDRLERIDRTIQAKRDRERMWNELVGPVVQLAGDSTVGSGVLLASQPTSETDKWQTHLLTAWHVVRDIYGSPDKTDTPVPVKMYLANGNVQFEHAHLVAHDVKLDVALLLLDSDHRVPCGARLPSRQRLENVRIFDPVYAVGCPLGNDPIPTCGEIAATQHEVDNERYWMISAPTYIGNSGGGIFDADSHELLGIFSKIYTHGALRSTIVPHMGLATPLITVYDWLEHEGLAEVEQQSPVGAPAMAAATR